MHTVSADDRGFVERFESGAWTPVEFNHRAHVRLAYAYLAGSETEAAVARMQTALLSFLRRHGIDTAKYHETLTRAWVMAVRHFMDRSGPTASADAFIDANPVLLDPQIMLTHYSAAVLFSAEARRRFVPPDVSPIPADEG